MSTTEDVQAGSNTDVQKRWRASWLLHGCSQQMTCKLALTSMSTIEDVQAGSNTDVHNRWRASWLWLGCPQQMSDGQAGSASGMYIEDDVQVGNSATAIKYKHHVSYYHIILLHVFLLQYRTLYSLFAFCFWFLKVYQMLCVKIVHNRN